MRPFSTNRDKERAVPVWGFAGTEKAPGGKAQTLRLDQGRRGAVKEHLLCVAKREPDFSWCTGT